MSELTKQLVLKNVTDPILDREIGSIDALFHELKDVEGLRSDEDFKHWIKEGHTICFLRGSYFIGFKSVKLK